MGLDTHLEVSLFPYPVLSPSGPNGSAHTCASYLAQEAAAQEGFRMWQQTLPLSLFPCGPNPPLGPLTVPSPCLPPAMGNSPPVNKCTARCSCSVAPWGWDPTPTRSGSAPVLITSARGKVPCRNFTRPDASSTNIQSMICSLELGHKCHSAYLSYFWYNALEQLINVLYCIIVH